MTEAVEGDVPQDGGDGAPSTTTPPPAKGQRTTRNAVEWVAIVIGALAVALVVKTFRKYFGKSPLELFDTFNPNAINAASIGQVHKATFEGKELAVKIQYPGVAESISSDLALVKPIAMKMFNIQAKDSDKYFKEVETKLTEETNYILEIANSTEIASAVRVRRSGSHASRLREPNAAPSMKRNCQAKGLNNHA